MHVWFMDFSQFANFMCQKKNFSKWTWFINFKSSRKIHWFDTKTYKRNMSNTKGSAKHTTHAQKNYYLNPSFSFSFFRCMDILPF